MISGERVATAERERLRDEFAMAVIQGWGEGFHGASYKPNSAGWNPGETYAQRAARFAFELADAMMAERERCNAK